jgi:glycosyltransferase involved in cell wall biosynthesis
MGVPRYLTVARLGGYYKRSHFRRSDYFVTITPDIRRYLIGEGVDPDRVRHINNFAETEDAGAPADRAALGTPDDAALLLALGRLHRAKALDTLLDAVAQVPDVYLWIAGEGPDRAALEAQARSLGIDNRVRFLGWREDRAALLSAADICVFPSRYEPFGTVFVQAWAQRTALVTTASDGPRQYVRDGVDGLMVPVDDTAALAAALRRMAGDPTLRVALAAAGHARYEAEFTREATVAAYRAFYREIRAREGLGQ